MSENKINWRDHEVGAIWNKQNGSLSLKLTIEGKTYNLVAMVNKFKDSDAKPSYRIYNLPPQNNGASTPTTAASQPVPKNKTPQTKPATVPTQSAPQDSPDEGLL